MSRKEIEREYEECFRSIYPNHTPENFWSYDAKRKVIETPDGYWIRVRELEDPEFGWISHLAKKSWFSKKVQIELFRKLDEVLRNR